MKRSVLSLSTLAVLAFPAAASAQTFYASRGAFDAAFPGATREDFQDANAPAGGWATCPSPANAGTANSCFDPSDIVPGVSFSVPTTSNGFFLVGDGYQGGTMRLVCNYSLESLQIDFNPPVFAAAADLVSIFNDGTITVTAYDAGGGFAFADDEVATSPGTFWGFSTNTGIGRLVVSSAGSLFEGIDNLAFAAFRCGDGIVTSPEACDTTGESNVCDDDCTAVGCGDGNTNEAAGEQCDTVGASAGCDADCTAATCGDGVTNGAAGEACDDGGESSACDGDCTAVVCGDGLVNASAGEACDEGAPSETCNESCRIPGCGDAVLGAGEDCDDGEQTATCDADCSFVACGDSFVNTAAGEGCDDGGESPACNADCTPSLCGDEVVNVSAGEQCDDGGTTAGDGCSPGCQVEASGAGGGGEGGNGQGAGSSGSSGDGGDASGGPTAGPSAGPSTGPSAGPSAGPTASVDAASGSGGDDRGDAASGGDDDGSGGAGDAAAASDGCGCSLPGATSTTTRDAVLGVIALGVVVASRRRRARVVPTF